MTRAMQRTVGRALIAALLLAQMMVAAYACPALATQGADERMPAVAVSHGFVAFSEAADMPAGCDGATFDSPNLCAAHCQAGDQNTDTTSPAVPAGVLASFYIVPISSAPGELNRNPTPTEAIGALLPPHAILHCCFRI